MANKYDHPDWGKSPVRKQIAEALEELEKVKAAWKSLERIAGTIENIRRLAREKMAANGHNKARSVHPAELAKERLRLANVSDPIMIVGQQFAEEELKNLTETMKELAESEIGIHSLMSTRLGSQAREFAAARGEYLTQRADAWSSLRQMRGW